MPSRSLPGTLATLVVVILHLSISAAPSAQQPETQGEAVTERSGRQLRLLEAAAEFRELALSDHTTALDRYVTPDARERLGRLDRVMWPASAPRLGWSFFMSTSVSTVGALLSSRPVVAFYHPWSDVYLLTEWDMAEAAGDEIRLADAEVLMGDWLRSGGVPPFSPIPAWLRSQLFKPAALAMAAAEAVVAFETAVPLAAEDAWRSRLPRGNDSKLLEEHNAAGVPLLLAASLQNLETCHSPSKGEDPRLAPVRRAVADLTERAARGDVKPLLQGQDTTEETDKVLRDLPDEFFAALQPVSVILGRQDLLVFLACLRQPDLVMSLVFEADAEGRPALGRVDLLSYGQAYRRLVEE